MNYPEADKVMEVREKSQPIGAFMDWLFSDGRVLCEWHDKGYYDNNGDRVLEYDPHGSVEPEGYHPTRDSIESLLALYFDIDLKKYQQEREQMFAEIQRIANLS